MARRKIAPDLEWVIDVYESQARSPLTVAGARRELRCLLAVARAAKKMVVLDGAGGCLHPAGMKEYAIPIARALYRLDRASRAVEEGTDGR
jgi:hypothetical protein